MKLSVVIITKNEAGHIGSCIRSAARLTDDIIVVDAGSEDGTTAIASYAGANVYSCPWRGYGFARNMGASYAANDWILSIDADERITGSMLDELNKFEPNDCFIYGFRRNNFFKDKLIRYGSLSHDKVYRLYNRTRTGWDGSEVHEKLLTTGLNRQMLKNSIDHYGITDIEQYISKRMLYAELCALKYYKVKKRGAFIFQFLSPIFCFFKCFFLQAGILSGRKGLFISMLNSKYTAAKYRHLHRLNQHGRVIAGPPVLRIPFSPAKAFEAL